MIQPVSPRIIEVTLGYVVEFMQNNSSKPVPTLIDEEGRIVSSDQDTYVDTTSVRYRRSARPRWVNWAFMLVLIVFGIQFGLAMLTETHDPIPPSLFNGQYYQFSPLHIPDLSATEIASGVRSESAAEALPNSLAQTISREQWIDGDTRWIHNVTQGVPLCFDQPVTSKEKIAYVSLSIQNSAEGTLYVSSPDGNQSCRLTPQGMVANSTIDWTSNGERIAFTAYLMDDRSQTGIFSLNQDDPAPRLLTSECNSAVQPDWSLDETKMLFKGMCGSQYGLFILYLNGVDNLPSLQYLHDGDDAQWSPNGQQIAFTARRDSTFAEEYVDLFVMESNGTNIVRLTTTEAHETKLSWSPGGRYIVFALLQQDTGADLVRVNVPTGKLMTLTADGAIDRDPIWLSDGRIAFVSNWLSPDFNHHSAIFTIPRSSRQIFRHSAYMHIGVFDWYIER